MPSSDNAVSSAVSSITSRFSSPEVDRLSAAAGSEEALSRGHWVAIGTLAVGMVGALGVAARPVLLRRFAPAAAHQDAVSAAVLQRRAMAGRVDPKVRAMCERLRVLQAAHLARHPMWHGFAEAPPAGRGGGTGGVLSQPPPAPAQPRAPLQ